MGEGLDSSAVIPAASARVWTGRAVVTAFDQEVELFAESAPALDAAVMAALVTAAEDCPDQRVFVTIIDHRIDSEGGVFVLTADGDISQAPAPGLNEVPSSGNGYDLSVWVVPPSQGGAQ